MHSTVSNKCKVTWLYRQLESFDFLRNSFVFSFISEQPDIIWCFFTAACVFVLSSIANSEYYKLLMRNGQDERRDTTVCAREELERVTSEHTLKNTVSTHTTQKHTRTDATSFCCPDCGICLLLKTAEPPQNHLRKKEKSHV